jgi:hypothetical protein
MSLGGSSSSARNSSSASSNKLGFNISGQQLDQTQLGNQQALLGQFNNQLQATGTGQGFQGHAQQLAQGNTQGQQLALQQAQAGQAGTQNLQQFSNTLNPFAQQSIQQLGSNLGDVFRNELLPGIGSNFQQAGQRGSSRQGVAQGLASQGVLNQFQQGATGILNNAFNTAQQSSAQLAQLGQGAQGQFLQGQLGGINAFQGLRQGQFAPFQIGAGIVGQPSTLTQSFGFDTATAQSQSKGKSKSQSLNVAFE